LVAAAVLPVNDAAAAPVPVQVIATGLGPGGGPHVKTYNVTADVPAPLGSFYGFGESFRGGVDVALGDLDGDGVDEVLAAAGPGGGPHVRAFKLDGTPVAGWSWFAYDGAFKGGVHVGAVDLDGDGKDEVITAPGVGGGPHVKVWKLVGGEPKEEVQFFAYDALFSGGVFVSGVSKNGQAGHIVTGAGPGGGPHVKFFSASGVYESGFFADASDDSNTPHNGGVTVAGTYYQSVPGTGEQYTGPATYWGALGSVGRMQLVKPDGGFLVPGSNKPWPRTHVGTYSGGSQVGGGGWVAPYAAGQTNDCADLVNCKNVNAQYIGRVGLGPNTTNATAEGRLAPYGTAWVGGLRVAYGTGVIDDPNVPTTTSTTTSSTTSTSIPSGSTSS
jgi:hypothetical protein